MPTIERIETIALRVPLTHIYKGSYYKMRNRCTIITRIHTSDGIVGQSYNADTDEEQHEVLSIIHDELAPLVTGLDIAQPELIWHSMIPATLDQLRDRAIPPGRSVRCDRRDRAPRRSWPRVHRGMSSP